MIKSVNTIQKLSLGQYGKKQSNTDNFRIARFLSVQQQLDRNPLDVSTFARKFPERYWTD